MQYSHATVDLIPISVDKKDIEHLGEGICEAGELGEEYDNFCNMSSNIIVAMGNYLWNNIFL